MEYADGRLQVVEGTGVGADICLKEVAAADRFAALGDQAGKGLGAITEELREPGLWIGIGAALVLLTGCHEPPRSMSYDQQDATRVNAINALAVANNAVARVEELETRAEELEGRVDELEAGLDM